MEKRNETALMEFFILGFTDNPKMQLPLFISFLAIYLTTLVGNLLIIGLVCLDSHLKTPMYVFLCNLAVLDICYTSVTIPKLLQIHLTLYRTMFFSRCITQLYFFSSIAIIEYYLLAMMALDRFVAICKPLHYTTIMNRRLCIFLLGISWIAGFLSSVAITVLTSRLSFCRSRVINHLFCDVKPLMQLSCTDTRTLEHVILVASLVSGICPFTLICTSYIYIITTILKINSPGGRKRAFSTCSSHLVIVCLFCGIIICTYAAPVSRVSLEKDKILAVLYADVIPMLNPLIYSFRNREVKCALKKIRQKVSQKLKKSAT